MKTICIDPGHGLPGDPGATSKGVKESEIVLSISFLLAHKLLNQGYKVIMTRAGVRYPQLEERPKLANENNADIFLSIHANAFSDRSAEGIETLYYPGSDKGQKLAQFIQDNLVKDLGRENRGIKSRKNLLVLRETKMPAVLCEVGFITNNIERELLQRSSMQLVIAESITKSVDKFFKE